MILVRKAKAVLSSARNNNGEPSVATGGKTSGWSVPPCFQEYFLRWNKQKGAENICVQLGYVSGTWYRAPGCSGPIQVRNRQCSGGEETVWDCPLMGGMYVITVIKSIQAIMTITANAVITAMMAITAFMAIIVLFITATIVITTKIEKLIDVATITVLMGITAIVAIRANMAITGIIAITAIIIILVIVTIVSYKANGI